MKQYPAPQLLALFVLLLTFSCQTESSKEEEYKLNRPLEEAHLQIDAEPDQLNPLLTLSNYSNTVIALTACYLQSLDPESMEMRPQLAQSRPEIALLEDGPYAGGVSYTFEIRPEAVWDNGSPVMASDFVFTLKAAFNPKVPAPVYRVYLSFIKEVVIDTDNPKRFTVFSDKRYIIGEEAISAALPVLPAYHYDAQGLMADIELSDLLDETKVKALAESDERLGQFAEQFTSPTFSREPEGIVGCGPYRLVSWETGQRLVLERKTDWWGDQVTDKKAALAAYPARIVFRPIQDPNTAIAALKDGQIDVMANIPPAQFLELKETEFVSKQYNFHAPLSLVHSFIYVNTRNPKLEDARVRRAVAYATDVETMISTVFSGLATPSNGPVHPSFSYYNKSIKPIPYQPEEARRLLEEAGWTDTNGNGIADKVIDGTLTELSLEYKYTAGRDIAQNVALLLQESAKKAGIEIKLTPQEHTVNMDNLKRRDYELMSGAKGIQPTAWEPKQDFHSEGDDRTGFATPETDAFIDEIQITLDKAKREEMYLELQARINQAMPIVPLVVPTGRLAVHKRFEGPVTAVFPGYVPRLLQLKD